MLRLQDVLFGVFGIAIVALLAFHIEVGVLAMLGASGCGCIYLFAGMIPATTDSFGNRAFVSVFLACVLSCLVLILPGTFGLQGPHPGLIEVDLLIAAALPIGAFGFEVLRTPHPIRQVLRWLSRR